MAVAHVQTIKKTQISGGGSDNTSITVAAGSLILVGVAMHDPGSGDDSCSSVTTSVATQGGLTQFTRSRHAQTGSASDFSCEIWYIPNATAGAQTITCNFTNPALQSVMFVTEASGVATSSPEDLGGTATGTSANPATGAIVVVATSFRYAIVLAEADLSTLTADSPWTIPTNGAETNGATIIECAVAYNSDAGTTSMNGQFTFNVSGVYKIAAEAYLSGVASNQILWLRG